MCWVSGRNVGCFAHYSQSRFKSTHPPPGTPPPPLNFLIDHTYFRGCEVAYLGYGIKKILLRTFISSRICLLTVFSYILILRMNGAVPLPCYMPWTWTILLLFIGPLDRNLNRAASDCETRQLTAVLCVAVRMRWTVALLYTACSS